MRDGIRAHRLPLSRGGVIVSIDTEVQGARRGCDRDSSPIDLAFVLPLGARWARVNCDDPDLSLPPEEEPYVARAVPARRREFAAGRAAARLALSRFGVERPILLPDEDRCPIWPEGIVGSISHTAEIAIAAVASASKCPVLGVDIEKRWAVHEDLGALVLCAEEQRALAALPSDHQDEARTLIFSAKEASFKAYYPKTRHRLGFRDARVQFDPEARSFECHLVHSSSPRLLGQTRLRGAFSWQGEIIATAAWV